MSATNSHRRPVSAWAAVSKRSGKVLRDLDGHYAIYTHFTDAEKDCPTGGEVRAVKIRVLPLAINVKGKS